MKILSNLLNHLFQRQPRIPKWLPWIILVAAVLGFGDSAYLTIQHYQGTTPPCAILEGCEVVTTSRFAKILNIPVALLGSLYYLAIIILAVNFLDTKKDKIMITLVHLTWVGLLASLWFVFAQFVILDAICLYCLGSIASSLLLFILGIITYFEKI